MTLLIDNDIVHKLAQLDLLDLAANILLERYGSLAVLNTLRFKFCPSDPQRRRKVESRYSTIVIDRLEAFINRGDINEIDCEVTDIVLVEAMSNSVDGLDIGEMQLLQTLVNGNGDMIFTGDKRFLKALQSSAEIQVYAERLNQSFVCFEQIMIFLIKSIGFEQVKNNFLLALAAGLKVDTTLIMCFEGLQNAAEERVMDNLNVFVGYLQPNGATLILISVDPIWMIDDDNVDLEQVPAA